MEDCTYTYTLKIFLAIFLSFSLVIASLPVESLGSSYLAPPKGRGFIKIDNKKEIIETVNRDVRSILVSGRSDKYDFKRALELLDGIYLYAPENPHTLCNYAHAYIMLAIFERITENKTKYFDTAWSYAEKSLQKHSSFIRGYYVAAWIYYFKG